MLVKPFRAKLFEFRSTDLVPDCNVTMSPIPTPVPSPIRIGSSAPLPYCNLAGGNAPAPRLFAVLISP